MASDGKYYLVTLLCIFAASSNQATLLSATDQRLTIKHEKWMAKHGRYYESEEEKEERFKIFKDNLEYIERFNREGNHTYKLGVNEFADLMNEEFLAKYAGGFRPSFQGSPGSSFKYENVKAVPKSLDWRERNAVTPVGTQGQCGCCWAFSAVAAIEGIEAIKSGKRISLSEQQIMDCNGGHEGCYGGRMEHAFDFVKQKGGLASDANYPYQSRQGACYVNIPSSLAVKITGYEFVPSNNESEMLKAVANQPVSVGIDPSLLQFYQSGILTGDCRNIISHAVTAVGYGASENGTKFWIFKNSWGPHWGEKGYLRVQRDTDTKEGVCGLAMDLCYPTA